QAINVNLPPLLFVIFRDEFQISYEMIGRLILINFGTQIIVDYLAARHVDRIGIRPAVVAAHVCSVVGLAGLGIFPGLLPDPYVGLVIAVVIFAIGGGLIEVLVSPIVESLPTEAKASAMSILHSFYCWGQMGVVLITTLLLQAFGSGIWHVLPLFWALIPFGNAILFLKVPLIPPLPEHEKIPLKQLVRSRGFGIAMILMLCAGASELTMAQWSSLFAEKGLGIPKIWGDLLGPCLFAVFMGIGRTLFGVQGHRIRLKNALLVCSLLCVVCYLLTVFIPEPVIALLACAFCGFTVSLMWPGTFSLTAAVYPRGGTLLFGLLAMSGDLGGSFGPWLAGWISDQAQKSAALVGWGSRMGLSAEQVGLKTGLLSGTVFPLLLAFGVISLIRAEEA
ncbi:MAG TPA: MFS transporter, partial [Clostridiales bacterium]|nr:MFS transporter [Clostridiales bacterium]